MVGSDGRAWFKHLLIRLDLKRIDRKRAIEEFKSMMDCYAILDETVKIKIGEHNWDSGLKDGTGVKWNERRDLNKEEKDIFDWFSRSMIKLTNNGISKINNHTDYEITEIMTSKEVIDEFKDIMSGITTPLITPTIFNGKVVYRQTDDVMDIIDELRDQLYRQNMKFSNMKNTVKKPNYEKCWNDLKDRVKFASSCYNVDEKIRDEYAHVLETMREIEND